MNYPDRIHLREVSPRDGLQAETEVLSVSARIALVDKITEAGFPQINVASFVSPRRVPQMAGADEVLVGIRKAPGTVYDVTVPNLKGAELAHAAGAEAITVFVSASEAGSVSGVGKSTAEALKDAVSVIDYATANGMQVFGTVSKAFGSAYEGVTPIETVIAIAETLVGVGASAISLGDTSGEATPLQVARTVETMLARLGGTPLALHLHDTRGMALANTLAAMDAGATRFDGAIGGIGGSPFTRNSAGNLATEDFLHMCDSSGIETGIDIGKVLEIYRFLEETLGHSLPGRIGAVGLSKTAMADA